MDTEIIIQKMDAERIPQVAEIEAACFADPWSEKSLCEQLDNPIAVFYTAVVKYKAVGYIGMHHIVDEGYITNIAVLPEYRRKGIAKLLLANLIEYAEQHALSFITLEVRKSNEPAIKLYNEFSFRTEGERRNFYDHPKEDAYIMTKHF